MNKVDTAPTEIGLDHWRAGLDRNDFEETDLDGEWTQEVLDTGMRMGELLDQFESETIELITLWLGYIDSSLGESVQPSVEDFVLATYVINKEAHRGNGRSNG